jgi:2-hydroxyglutarate dehydrogenase
MYKRCDEYNIPYRKTGKLVVAHEDQRAYIESLHTKANKLCWPKYSSHKDTQDTPVLPTELLTGDQAREMVPDLSSKIVAALWSPETGILDSHSFMESLEKDIIDSEGGELVYGTKVVRVDAYERSEHVDSLSVDASEDGWVVQTVTGGDEEGDAMLARNLIVSSGLSGPIILNSLLPEQSRIPVYYGRGTYASYSGKGLSPISRLIYPGPNFGAKKNALHSLGTHLTVDMEGKVRFGPDLEWISPPSGEEDPDFWRKHLVPNDLRLEEMHRAVMDYLPGVKIEGMRPDYVGIRPKLIPPQGGFQDFVFRTIFPNNNRRRPMINLLGIESPGLTSSLAIAEYVVEDILENCDR